MIFCQRWFFALLAFEAYLNFLGERLAPEIWNDERKFFEKIPYRGFDGRVRKVFELCHLAEPARDQKPYITIWKLKNLRDLIVHGKVEKLLREFTYSEDTVRPLHSVNLYELVSYEKACQARDNVLEVACSLHTAASNLRKTQKTPPFDPWFGDHPFEGARGYAIGSTKVVPLKDI